MNPTQREHPGQSKPERITLYRCASNAQWNIEHPTQAHYDPALTHVLCRCGDAATNVACDCPAVTFEEVREA